MLFALGVFDKPHTEFDWHKVFDFDSDEKIMPQASNPIASKAGIVPSSEVLSSDDMSKLSVSIKNLSQNAN
jgi:hypothetical protein